MNKDSVENLSGIGIHSVDDMLGSARTRSQRENLSDETCISSQEIFEIAKLSNLTHLGAVKAVRARLYHDAGFDTIDKVAKATAEELIRVTKEFIDSTDFDGIPPTPKEAANAVKKARKLTDEIEM